MAAAFKNMDVSKSLNKAVGVSQTKEKEIAAYLKERRLELALSKSYVDKIVFGGSTRYSFVEGREDTTGAGRIYLPTPKEWKLLKDVLGLDDRFDGYIQAAIPERELRHRADGGKGDLVSESDGDFGYQQSGHRWAGTQREVVVNDDAAKQFSGYGTALKPAYEPIILCRKPLEGTVAANVLKHGTGALNIDGCRVEGAPEPTRFDPNKHAHDGWRMSATGAECAERAKELRQDATR